MASSNDDFRTKHRPRRYDQMWQGVDYPAIKRLRREEQLCRYPRGMIFCGDYGCGKTTAARIRGMRSSCWNHRQDTVEPCGDCAGCRAAMARKWCFARRKMTWRISRARFMPAPTNIS